MDTLPELSKGAHPKHTGPLSGVRILDLTTVVMGPYATMILSNLGADIIKLEPPSGDIMRHVGPMKNKLMGHSFINANHGKRSIVLDLKKTTKATHVMIVCIRIIQKLHISICFTVRIYPVSFFFFAILL